MWPLVDEPGRNHGESDSQFDEKNTELNGEGRHGHRQELAARMPPDARAG